MTITFAFLTVIQVTLGVIYIVKTVSFYNCQGLSPRTPFLRANRHPCIVLGPRQHTCILGGVGGFDYRTFYSIFSVVYGQDILLLAVYF